MAGMGYVPASQGGTHIVERNLTRLTVAVGTVFFANSIILYHILS
jgi:preprotein translocase subunit SecG